MVPVVVIMEMNTMKRNIKMEEENEVIMLIRMVWGYCYQYSKRFLLGWALVLRSTKRIMIRKRGLTMEIPISQSIEKRNMNVSVILPH